MANRRKADRLDVLRFLRDYIDRYGYSPTVREVMAGVGLQSTSAVHRWLQLLEQEQLIVSVPATPRTIRISDQGKVYMGISK